MANSTPTNAAVAELEYAYGSEPYVERLVGSNPTRGIIFLIYQYNSESLPKRAGFKLSSS